MLIYNSLQVVSKKGNFLKVYTFIYIRDIKGEKKMLSLLRTNPSHNDRNGNGKYSAPRRRKKCKNVETNSEEFSYLQSSVDLTMQFCNGRDPIYLVFEKLENRSVPDLMTEFVKDSFFEISKFVSKVIK